MWGRLWLVTERCLFAASACCCTSGLCATLHLLMFWWVLVPLLPSFLPADVLACRCAASLLPQARAAGLVINSMGWVEDLGEGGGA